MTEVVVKRVIKRLGNGAMVSVHRADLEQLGADVGASVEVTIKKIDDTYDATRQSAARMRKRFARTLELLGQ